MCPTIGVCVFNKDTSEVKSDWETRGKMPPPARGREKEHSRCRRRSTQVESCPIARWDKGYENNNNNFLKRQPPPPPCAVKVHSMARDGTVVRTSVWACANVCVCVCVCVCVLPNSIQKNTNIRSTILQNESKHTHTLSLSMLQHTS